MKTLVLTGGSGDLIPVLEATLPLKQTWASFWGYDLKVIREWNPVEKYGSHIGFLRVNAVIEALKEYDRVAWIDGDSMITNPSISAGYFFRFTDAPFCASYDWADDARTFSTGNFLMRRTPLLPELIYRFEEAAPRFMDHPEAEQATLNHLRNEQGAMFHILPTRYLNAVPEAVYTCRRNEHRRITHPWRPGDFLAHLTTAPNPDRLRILTEGLPIQVDTPAPCEV